MARSRAGTGRSRRALTYLAVGAAACVLGSCSPGRPAARAAKDGVRITERDFHIAVTPTHVPAGEVVLTVKNLGPDNHELIVVRAGDSSLPLRADGITIDEDRLEKLTLGALEPGAPDTTRHLRLHLRPGRYELFCNMSGHFFGGMHTELVVS